MSRFIRCPECSKELASLYDFFDASAECLIQERSKQDNKKFGLYDFSNLVLEDMQIDFGELLNLLRLTNDCCRMHMISRTNYHTRFK